MEALCLHGPNIFAFGLQFWLLLFVFPHCVCALKRVSPLLDQSFGRKELLKYLAKTMDSNQVLGLVIIGSRGLEAVHGLTRFQ